MDSAKKYEPKYRLARHGVIEKKKTESRRSRRKKRGSPTLPRPPHSRRFLEHRFIIESSAARIEMTKNCELLNMIPSQLAGFTFLYLPDFQFYVFHVENLSLHLVNVKLLNAKSVMKKKNLNPPFRISKKKKKKKKKKS